jgi:hypothetical protein
MAELNFISVGVFSYGSVCSSELVQEVDRFLTHNTLTNPHPTGSPKG